MRGFDEQGAKAIGGVDNDGGMIVVVDVSSLLRPAASLSLSLSLSFSLPRL